MSLSPDLINLNEIQKILPQRYPFLLIDKVVALNEHKSLTAIKNITGNEWTAHDHVDATDHFPEVLIIEASAQATLCLTAFSCDQKNNSSLVYLIGKIEAEFFGPVKIGDQLILKVLSGKVLSSGGYADVEAFVADQLKAKVKLFYSVKKND